MLDFFREGGEFMYVTAVVGVMAWAFALVAVGLKRGRGAPGALAGSYGVIFASGLVGALSGVVITEKAVATALAVEQPAMTLVGLSIALHPLMLALALAAPLVVIHAVGAIGGRDDIPRGPADRVSGVGVALALLLGGLAAFSLVVGLARLARTMSYGGTPAGAAEGVLLSGALSALSLGVLSFTLVVFGLVVGVRRLGAGKAAPEEPAFVPLSASEG